MHPMCLVILMFMKKLHSAQVRSVMFAAASSASPARCSAVYLLDSGPVCDGAVGVWRERGRGALTACWLAGCCRWKHFKPPANTQTDRSTHSDVDTQINKRKHWYTVCGCTLVEAWKQEWYALLCECGSSMDVFISFHSGCVHTKRLLSQIFLSISLPLLFPPSSVCLSLSCISVSLSLFCVF